MTDTKTYDIPASFAKNAHLDEAHYLSMYQRSIEDPAAFWAEQADAFLSWDQRWDTVLDWDFHKGHIRWFEGARLNACYNCVDRHLETRGDQTAFIWEGDDPAKDARITYRQLHERVCRLANVLKSRGVKKGDRVCIYMPMIPEAAYAMLACARIGAVHSVVFGGFSPESIKDRILDSDCRTVITADEGLRGSKHVPLKANVDAALRSCPNVSTVVTVRVTGAKINWVEGRDIWYQEEAAKASAECPVESMDAEDPLFILYTSGSTGKPKGVLHTTGGYLLFAAITHKYVFDHPDTDVYWCAADIGWVTGHSYIVYGPLTNGATSVIYEGTPDHPHKARLWEIVETYGVTQLYTAPTAIRTFMKWGPDEPASRDLSSLRLLGTVGEPINPEAWMWYHQHIGGERCPIVDTWWQTETGGHMITPLPGATIMKPGSATRPFFGVRPALVNAEGKLLEGAAEGNLVITHPWPGMMRTVYGDHQRFIDTYFRTYMDMYFTGDGARRDEDGFYWITGRVDDVLNVSGHRIGTAELESALVLHDAVAEAAVVGYPHDIKGQGIYAYVTLVKGVEPSDALRKELIKLVRAEIGPIATPDVIQWAPGLPKTRSGKIMRRILRKIAANDMGNLGDTTTLADPSVVDDLIRNRAS
jgi:acetyl-CoA synthetase